MVIGIAARVWFAVTARIVSKSYPRAPTQAPTAIMSAKNAVLTRVWFAVPASVSKRQPRAATQAPPAIMSAKKAVLARVWFAVILLLSSAMSDESWYYTTV